jgi:hypothetical protein
VPKKKPTTEQNGQTQATATATEPPPAPHAEQTPSEQRDAHAEQADSPTAATHETALVPASETEGKEATLVLKERERMRRDVASRLAGMMSDLRCGLQVELVEFHSALRDATLRSIASRLEAINSQVAQKVCPLLKPSIRSTLKELTGILAGVFLQMLVASDPDGDLEEKSSEARAMAEAAVKELVPNSERLG